MKTRIVHFFLLIGIFIQPATALAYSQSNITIDRVGVQGTSHYVSFIEPLSTTCKYSNIYFGSDKKSSLALVLAIKAQGKKVSRMDYTKDSNGQCNLDLIEFK